MRVTTAQENQLCYICFINVFFCIFKLYVPCFNSSFSDMLCFALISLACYDLSSSHNVCPLAALGTVFLESQGWLVEKLR